jgi:hypothetical protein
VGDGLALEHLGEVGEAALRFGTIAEAIDALERRDTPSPLGE